MIRRNSGYVSALFVTVFFFVPLLASAACFSSPLSSGDTSPEVTKVQEFLKIELGLEFDVTNYYGSLTRQAVYSFQNKYASEILTPIGLTQPTGVWGSSTMQKANALCDSGMTSDVAASPTPVSITAPAFTGEDVAYGRTNEQIRLLQELLNKEVNAGLPLTGYFGPMTQEALKQFQLKYKEEVLTPLGLASPTGVFGPATRAKVQDLMASEQGSTSSPIDASDQAEPEDTEDPRPEETEEEEDTINDRDEDEDDDEDDDDGGRGPFPANVEEPAISGDTDLGDTLTTTDGTWTGRSIVFSYQWFRDGSAISGATSSSYAITYADPGTDISAVVTATNRRGAVTATSSEISIPLPSISTIAFFGDSITGQSTRGSTGTDGVGAYYIDGVGYSSWAKALNQSKWDFEPDGGRLTFATGGKTTQELIDLHLEDVLASDADVVVEQGGTNDIDRGFSTTTIVTNKVNVWTQIRESGMIPVTMAIPPFGLAQGGNATGTKSVRVVQANTAIQEAAEEMGVPFVSYDGQLDTVAGNGIANTSMFTDALHPNGWGAYIMGEALAEVLEDSFIMPLDNWANTNYLTPNVALAGSSGQPTSWLVPGAPSGATLNSKALESSADGNWWVFDVMSGTSTSSFALNNFTSNLGGSPVGKTVESLAEIEVVSGTFKSIRIDTNMFGNTGQNTGMLTGWNFAPVLTSDDGIIVLRTQPNIVPVGTSLVSPTVYFNGDGVIRFRRVMTREVVAPS